MGKKAVVEMNKWGIMIDVSHPSKQANIQMMQLSKAPVIASHSSRALFATTAVIWTTNNSN
jgi:microsomal dipeptidase-like Zn-dependent dipeptidase